MLVAACASPPLGSDPAPSGSASPASPATSTAPSGVAGPAALVGTWDGALTDPSGSFQARLTLAHCSSVGSTCGTLEYLDPAGTVICASDLTSNGVEDERLVLAETMTYQPWKCFPTTLRVGPLVDGGLEVAQYGDGPDPCCEGTFERIADGPVDEPLPALWDAPGVGRATAVIDLGGTGTQYADATTDALWMPLANRGRVARIDVATGAPLESGVVGDPGRVEYLESDPHSVVVADGAVWVALAAGRSIVRLDATGAVDKTIPIDATPYALAFDGESLWATSFNDDVVVRIHPVEGRVVARFAVQKPTGIATGEGGVWVVLHRDDAIVHIDPAIDGIGARIEVEPRGPDPLCGRCIENVVVADGKVWLSDNHGRAVVRVDPSTDTVDATIPLPHRVWSVTAGGGSIWASQLEEGADGARGIVRIDPRTLEFVTAEVPVFSVSWGADALWGLGYGRRGDVLYRIEPAPGG